MYTDIYFKLICFKTGISTAGTNTAPGNSFTKIRLEVKRFIAHLNFSDVFFLI